MTGKALTNSLLANSLLANSLLVAGGVAAAAAIWAGAILLPAPTGTQLALAPQTSLETPPLAPDQSQDVRMPASEPIKADPAAFGVLPAQLASALPARQSMLDRAGSLSGSATFLAPTSLAASALAPSTLQSIGATFTDSVLGTTLPALGGAAELDGPADAGLDQHVAQADVNEPQVAPPTGKIIVIDHSEGTKLDPLRQRNWDLNSAQVIPPMAAASKR